MRYSKLTLMGVVGFCKTSLFQFAPLFSYFEQRFDSFPNGMDSCLQNSITLSTWTCNLSISNICVNIIIKFSTCTGKFFELNKLNLEPVSPSLTTKGGAFVY